MNDDKELVLDLETTVKNVGEGAIGTLKANPFYRENRIVATGIKLLDTTRTIYEPAHPDWEEYLKQAGVLVAHNMQFDLKYLIRDHREVFFDWLQNGKLWCTMIAEYILSGMLSKFPSLDSLAPDYGGKLKDEKIKEYWQAGYDTDEIPKEELLEYLEGDVENTHKVYLGQLKRAKDLGMENVIQLHMDCLLGLILMEFNGCRFDLDFAKEEMVRLDKEQLINRIKLDQTMKKFFIEDAWEKVNPDSGDQLSIILFGGSYTYPQQQPVLDGETGEPVVFKSGIRAGQLKTRKVDVEYTSPGFGVTPRDSWKLKKEGFYSTDENTLKTIRAEATGELRAFINEVLHCRTLSKDNGTYFKGYSDLVFADGCIHHQLNTSQTNTGRLSSSKPNTQNLSK